MTTDDSYLFKDEKKRTGGGLARFCKFLFFVLAFLLVVMTIMANMGGSHVMHRESVEKFISDVFGGRPTTIGLLQDMSFFPSIGVHASNIEVLSKPEDEDGYPVVKIGQLEAYMGFWSVATSTQRFKKLSIQNVQAIKGIITPEEFTIKHIFIDHVPGEDTGAIYGEGRVGENEWSFEIGVQVHNTFTGKQYSIPQSTPFKINIADILIRGKYAKNGGEYFTLDDVNISQGKKSARIDLSVYTVANRLLKIRGTLQDGTNNAQIMPELMLNRAVSPHQLEGTVQFTNYTLEQNSDLGEMISSIRQKLGFNTASDIFGYLGVLDYNNNVNVTLNFEKLVIGETGYDLDIPYVQMNNHRAFGPITKRLKEEVGDKKENMLLPPFMVIKNKPSQTVFVIQEGKVDTGFASKIFSGFPVSVSSRESLSTQCGVGVISDSQDGALQLETMVIGMQDDAIITMPQQQIDAQNTLRSLRMNYERAARSLPDVALTKDAQVFVKKQLHKTSPNPTTCDVFAGSSDK